MSFGCATTRAAQGEGVVGCTAAADKYAKERNTIFVKRTTDNLPLNRAWHFKQAKPTTTTTTMERNKGEGVGAAGGGVGGGKTTRQKEIIKINKREKKYNMMIARQRECANRKKRTKRRRTKKIKKMKRK